MSRDQPATPTRRLVRPHQNRLRSLLIISLWLIAALFFLRGAFLSPTVRCHGVADREGRHVVATLVEGRLASIEQDAGSQVKAGAVVARLDSTAIDTALRLIEERLATIQVQSAAVGAVTAARIQVDGMDTSERLSRYESALTEAHAVLLAARREEAAQQAELTVIRRELQRRRGLVTSGLVRAEDLTDLECREAETTARLAALPRELATIETRRDDLARGLAVLKRQDKPSWPEMVQQTDHLDGERERTGLELDRLALLQERAELERQRGESLLRTPVDGTVVTVLGKPGDILRPGMPVCVILADGPRTATAWIDEANLRRIDLGQNVRVHPLSELGQEVAGRVARVGSEVTDVDPCLNLGGQIPTRGRPVLIEIADGSLIPGERVEVLIATTGPVLW